MKPIDIMTAVPLQQQALRPLCVDLDGTLIRTDLLHEAVFLLAKENPLALFQLPFWLMRGKAEMKAEIARRVSIDGSTLPYDEAVVTFLREEAAQGRPLVLATASHRSFADAVAAHLGFFTAVEATEGNSNCAGPEKARRLSARFGAQGFDYLGDSAADVPVWKEAAQALAKGEGAAELAQQAGIAVARTFPKTPARPASILRALRPHQWLKNLLVFVVLLAAHRATEPALILAGITAFFCFGLCASSVYLLNDLLDLPVDRRHPRKKERPFASGTLPVKVGAVLIPVLLLAAFGIAAVLLPLAFLGVLAVYYVTTLAYSVRLKKIVLVDVMTLAGLYTLRIIAGGAAVMIMPSFWLLAFSMFLFLSLALAKRYAELIDMRSRNTEKIEGRGYLSTDDDTLVSLGASAGYCSVLVLALYINGEAARSLYRLPELLWLICPLLLYWTSRVWIAARRGKLTDDPVIFAMKDSVSRWVFAVAGAIFVAASLAQMYWPL